MGAIYLDTSALVKLAVAEPETDALADWLAARGESPWCTSAIGEVELVRAAGRHSPEATEVAREVLAGCAILEVSPSVAARAARLAPTTLRTLDALHVASAVDLGDLLDAFVSYDQRQREAAVQAGLSVANPGQP